MENLLGVLSDFVQRLARKRRVVGKCDRKLKICVCEDGIMETVGGEAGILETATACQVLRNMTSRTAEKALEGCMEGWWKVVEGERKKI